jgi:hypothetical protein
MLEKRQRGLVSRVLLEPLLAPDGHFSRAPVTRRLERPDPRAGRATPLLSYSALLRVGFTEPTRSPAPLVSSYLTVSPLPFRQLVRAGRRRFAFCGTDPWGFPPWALPSTLPCGARTFLPPPRGDRRPSSLLWRSISISPTWGAELRAPQAPRRSSGLGKPGSLLDIASISIRPLSIRPLHTALGRACRPESRA